MSNNNDLLNSNGVFDPSAIEGIDPSMVNDSGPMYPIMQWHKGNMALKKVGGMDFCGGFFIKSDAIADDIMAAGGWEKTSWTHDDGKEEQGWWRRQAALSVIAMRERWEVSTGKGSRPLVFPWKSYDKAKAAGNPRGRLHVLCLVKGIEDAGPIILTMLGTTGLAFKGNGRDNLGALGQFQQTIITAANLTAKNKRWPLFAFWCPVGANRDANNEPAFTKVGSGTETSMVVMPIALGLPSKPQEVKNLGAFYIGNELLEVAKQLFIGASTNWAVAWENIKADAEQTAVAEAEPAAPAMTDLAALGV